MNAHKPGTAMYRAAYNTVCALLLLSLGACRNAEIAPKQQEDPPVVVQKPPAPANTAALTRVVSENVCMVNDEDMGKPQIPTTVDGKTYFGCCAMCKAKLEQNETARSATDPVTGHVVDKSTAVIARNEAGKVFYFESDATLQRYRP